MYLVVVDADGGGKALERHVDAVVPGAVAALAHDERSVLAAVQQRACLIHGGRPDEAPAPRKGRAGPGLVHRSKMAGWSHAQVEARN